eukprot:CAMPEP_0201571786 /NCGR_PEP_ID=MMETSP0190_2-20130828/14725_1 /ASSEMBLY_ACC=CAM_ASM_000263 /TAXON_ID=37353 /ORGANISM="Rosalina sp." /LENGTH=292 /DNA_ID=CAMNT_0047996809 /DNA_START=111 /DNA_END=986 /DNA_ORIENTATION=-
MDEKKCKAIKFFMVVFAVVVTIAVIIIMAVSSTTSSNEEISNNNQDVTCIKSSSYDLSSISCTDYPCISQYQSYIDTTFEDSTSWDQATSKLYLQAFHETELGQCIQNVNVSCQLRPAPTCYLPSIAIEYHLATFLENGGSFISSTKYASTTNFTELGYNPDDYDKNGVQWISPYNQETEILQTCAGSDSNNGGAGSANADDDILSAENCVLTALGIEYGDEDMFEYDWGKPTMINRVMQVNVYKTSLMDLNLRMASGNEQGVDSEWRAGGYTIDGAMEAVVDIIEEGDYCW